MCTRRRAGSAGGPIGVRGPRHNGGDGRRGDSRAAHVGPRNCTAAAERVKWLCVGHDGFEQGPCHANMFSK